MSSNNIHTCVVKIAGSEKFKRSKYGKDKTLLKESDVLMTKLENELVKSKDI